MEGPYRDLGAGFARLTGVEGLRRSPRRLRSVEDALVELLRNARDAGARNVYVASSLRARRYRALTVIDDGRGIPETYKRLIFEPGVTTRHLRPVEDASAGGSAHGAGLSLHHIKNAAVSAEVCSASSPTSLRVVFDTEFLPERSLQSSSRPSGSNLLATLAKFVQAPNAPRLYHASPARILARLLENRIIHPSKDASSSEGLRQEAEALGLEVSSRTAQRVLGEEVVAAGEVVEGGGGGGGRASGHAGGRRGGEGPILSVGEGDLAEIGAVLSRAARASYLELSGLVVEKRPGEIVVKARVYEPEEEYE